MAWLEVGNFTFYEQPILTGLLPRSARARSDLHGSGGDTLLRLQGFGFSNLGSTHTPLVLCRFGSNTSDPHTVATAVTATVLKCRTPAIAPGHVPVYATLNGQDYFVAPPSAANLTFFPPPVLLALSPIGGPVTGGTAVTVTAAGLLPEELMSRGLSAVTCRFGDAYHPDFEHVVVAQPGVTDDAAVCVSPSTFVGNYTEGRAYHAEVRVALNGGVEAGEHVSECPVAIWA